MQSIPTTELLKSIPEFFGIRVNEQPSYQLIEESGIIQIRHYPSKTLASVTLDQLEFDQFRNEAFEKLSRYIFGANRTREKIPMTAPILIERTRQIGEPELPPSPIFQGSVKQANSSQFGTWTMSLIMPEKKSLSNCPEPFDSLVSLRQVEARTVAALEYSGNNTKVQIQKHERMLSDWLGRHSDMTAFGEWIIAQYDAPFVIPALKRNEIQVEIVGTLNG